MKENGALSIRAVANGYIVTPQPDIRNNMTLEDYDEYIFVSKKSMYGFIRAHFGNRGEDVVDKDVVPI